VTDLFQFDADLELEQPGCQDSGDPPAATGDLEKWAEDQLADDSTALFFDIETGPAPEDQLQAMYHEKTLEEFSATCDKRWKPDTVAKKYEEYKAGAWEQFVGKAGLSATTGRVLLIGLLRDGEFAGIINDDERATLTAFWEIVANALDAKRRIIGHNSNGFDLPFLVRRSWMLGVHVPREVRRGRYWDPLCVDTMEAWGCGSRDFIRLNDLGQYFGVGQKTEGFAGKDFHKYWFGTAEQRQLAIDYCEQDVRLTAAIAGKMGLV